MAPTFSSWMLMLHTKEPWAPKSPQEKGTPTPQENRCSQARGRGSAGPALYLWPLQTGKLEKWLVSAQEGTPEAQHLDGTSRGQPFPASTP